jgi:hypothetical protein
MIGGTLDAPNPTYGDGVSRTGTDQQSCHKSGDHIRGTFPGWRWDLELHDGASSNGSHAAGLGDEQRFGYSVLKQPANTRARSGHAQLTTQLLSCNGRDGIVRRLSVQ